MSGFPWWLLVMYALVISLAQRDQLVPWIAERFASIRLSTNLSLILLAGLTLAGLGAAWNALARIGEDDARLLHNYLEIGYIASDTGTTRFLERLIAADVTGDDNPPLAVNRFAGGDTLPVMVLRTDPLGRFVIPGETAIYQPLANAILVDADLVDHVRADSSLKALLVFFLLHETGHHVANITNLTTARATPMDGVAGMLLQRAEEARADSFAFDRYLSRLPNRGAAGDTLLVYGFAEGLIHGMVAAVGESPVNYQSTHLPIFDRVLDLYERAARRSNGVSAEFYRVQSRRIQGSQELLFRSTQALLQTWNGGIPVTASFCDKTLWVLAKPDRLYADRSFGVTLILPRSDLTFIPDPLVNAERTPFVVEVGDRLLCSHDTLYWVRRNARVLLQRSGSQWIASSLPRGNDVRVSNDKIYTSAWSRGERVATAQEWGGVTRGWKPHRIRLRVETATATEVQIVQSTTFTRALVFQDSSITIYSVAGDSQAVLLRRILKPDTVVLDPAGRYLATTYRSDPADQYRRRRVRIFELEQGLAIPSLGYFDRDPDGEANAWSTSRMGEGNFSSVLNVPRISLLLLSPPKLGLKPELSYVAEERFAGAELVYLMPHLDILMVNYPGTPLIYVVSSLPPISAF
jgi:hypothetical protein